MAEFGMLEVLLAIMAATLGAIVYSLRVLVLMERRVARLDHNIEHLVSRIMQEELRIEKAIGVGKKSGPVKKKR